MKTSEELSKLGKKILDDINKKENPSIEIPIRALSNVIFDKKSGQLTLGSKTAKRYFFNVAHAKKFMQTLMVASFCKDLTDQKIHASIRDMFYNLKRTLPDSVAEKHAGEKTVCRKYRNVISCANVDAGIIIGGRIGTNSRRNYGNKK